MFTVISGTWNIWILCMCICGCVLCSVCIYDYSLDAFVSAIILRIQPSTCQLTCGHSLLSSVVLSSLATEILCRNQGRWRIGVAIIRLWLHWVSPNCCTVLSEHTFHIFISLPWEFFLSTDAYFIMRTNAIPTMPLNKNSAIFVCLISLHPHRNS